MHVPHPAPGAQDWHWSCFTWPHQHNMLPVGSSTATAGANADEADKPEGRGGAGQPPGATLSSSQGPCGVQDAGAGYTATHQLRHHQQWPRPIWALPLTYQPGARTLLPPCPPTWASLVVVGLEHRACRTGKVHVPRAPQLPHRSAALKGNVRKDAGPQRCACGGRATYAPVSVGNLSGGGCRAARTVWTLEGRGYVGGCKKAGETEARTGIAQVEAIRNSRMAKMPCIQRCHAHRPQTGAMIAKSSQVVAVRRGECRPLLPVPSLPAPLHQACVHVHRELPQAGLDACQASQN
jgi:hypothetical protein